MDIGLFETRIVAVWRLLRHVYLACIAEMWLCIMVWTCQVRLMFTTERRRFETVFKWAA